MIKPRRMLANQPEVLSRMFWSMVRSPMWAGRVSDPEKTRAPSRRPLGLAEWTGLEPATSGVTGQHSNRLNYHSAFCCPDALVGAEGFEPPTLSV